MGSQSGSALFAGRTAERCLPEELISTYRGRGWMIRPHLIPCFVIPAKAGIQRAVETGGAGGEFVWIPAFAGMTLRGRLPQRVSQNEFGACLPGEAGPALVTRREGPEHWWDTLHEPTAVLIPIRDGSGLNDPCSTRSAAFIRCSRDCSLWRCATSHWRSKLNRRMRPSAASRPSTGSGLAGCLKATRSFFDSSPQPPGLSLSKPGSPRRPQLPPAVTGRAALGAFGASVFPKKLSRYQRGASGASAISRAMR